MICQQVDPGEGLFSLRDRAAAVSQGLFSGRSPPLARWLGTVGSFGTTFGAVTGLTYLALRCRFGAGPARGNRQVVGGRPLPPWTSRSSGRWFAWSWSRLGSPRLGSLLPAAYLASVLLTAIGLSTLPRVAGLLAQFVRLRLARSEMWRLAVGITVVPALTIVLLASAFGRGLETPPKLWEERTDLGVV